MLEHRRDATRGGRHGAGREVLAFRVAGVLEVGVHVDRAGHHDEPGGIDQLVRRRTAAPGSASAAMRPSSITTSAGNTADSVATVPPAITVRFPLTAIRSR